MSQVESLLDETIANGEIETEKRDFVFDRENRKMEREWLAQDVSFLAFCNPQNKKHRRVTQSQNLLGRFRASNGPRANRQWGKRNMKKKFQKKQELLVLMMKPHISLTLNQLITFQMWFRAKIFTCCESAIPANAQHLDMLEFESKRKLFGTSGTSLTLFFCSTRPKIMSRPGASFSTRVILQKV